MRAIVTLPHPKNNSPKSFNSPKPNKKTFNHNHKLKNNPKRKNNAKSNPSTREPSKVPMEISKQSKGDSNPKDSKKENSN